VPSKLDLYLVDFGLCPEGLRRVPVDTRARFPLFQPGLKKLNFGLHFGDVLVAQSVVIGIFGSKCGGLEVVSEMEGDCRRVLVAP